MSVLTWVQTICKGYQQTIKVATSKVRVKNKSKKRNTYFTHLPNSELTLVVSMKNAAYNKFCAIFLAFSGNKA